MHFKSKCILRVNTSRKKKYLKNVYLPPPPRPHDQTPPSSHTAKVCFPPHAANTTLVEAEDCVAFKKNVGENMGEIVE